MTDPRRRSEGRSDRAVALTAARLIEVSDVPALLIDGEGRVADANDAGGALAVYLDRVAPGRLAGLVKRALDGDATVREEVTLEGENSAPQVLELAAAPLSPLVVVTARDLSFDRNLNRALIESRERYKDLVECSSEFAWETDADGRFVFVSPRGALGYAADELIGLPARDFVLAEDVDPAEDAEAADRADSAPVNPFETRARVTEVETRFRRRDGGMAFLLISAVPLDDGRGARGVCRDVTLERERAAELERAQRRERLASALIQAIRDETEVPALLPHTARAAVRLLPIDAVFIFRAEEETPLRLAASRAADGGEPRAPGKLDRTLFDLVAEMDAPFDLAADDGARMLVAATSHRQRTNGMIALRRSVEGPPWTDDDRALLLGLADQVGIAITQVAAHEHLARLSRTDALTGLLNRRAFDEEVARRIAHAARNRRPAALLYLDMDNFKPVNDRFGHERGDEAIRMLADALRGCLRSSDVVARLGGDEFAVWLDETDAEGARATADTVALAASPLSRFSADLDRPLTLSIGIATLAAGESEDLSAMLARADKAMYEAKRAGKGQVALDVDDASRADLVHDADNARPAGARPASGAETVRAQTLDSGTES